MNIPIFPLSIYLLPGGVTRLRIFEQRYLSMVKNANKTQGFVISHYRKDKKHHISEWGSWVDIIDFKQGDDNVLVIDVKCKGLVAINTSEYSDNKLLWGQVTKQSHWADKASDVVDEELTLALQQIFTKHHDLAEVYQGEFNEDLSWVCARWAELIPVNFEFKKSFAQANSFEQVFEFLQYIVKEHKTNIVAG